MKQKHGFLFIAVLAFQLLSPWASAQQLCSDIFSAKTVISAKSVDSKVENLLKSNRLQEAAWIALRLGDKASFDRIENNLKLELETGTVLSSDFMGIGAGETYLIQMKSGVRGVFKPDPQFWVQADSFAKDIANTNAEVDAYRVDRMLNLNVVPLTVEREFKGIRGSLQAFVSSEFTSAYDKTTYRKMRILDYLIHNTDRHELNFLISPEQVVAIDHGMAFRNSWLSNSPYLAHLEQLNFADFGPVLLERLKTQFTPDVAHRALTGRHSRIVVHQVLKRREKLIQAIEQQSSAPAPSK